MTIARDLANVASLMASSSANVAFDDSVVLNSGVANGVVYLNSSRVARTSSDFNFNGSLLNANVNLHFGASSANTITISSGSLTLNNNLSVNSGKYYFDQANTRLGINTSSPQVTLDINTTNGIKLPSGTTGERPSTPPAATIRWNTDDSRAEVYDGTTWKPLGSGEAVIAFSYFVASNI